MLVVMLILPDASSTQRTSPRVTVRRFCKETTQSFQCRLLATPRSPHATIHSSDHQSPVPKGFRFSSRSSLPACRRRVDNGQLRLLAKRSFRFELGSSATCHDSNTD